MRMKFAWKANTTPDIVFEISETAQVTRVMYEKDIIKYCKRVNKAIKYVHVQKTPFAFPSLIATR